MDDNQPKAEDPDQTRRWIIEAARILDSKPVPRPNYVMIDGVIYKVGPDLKLTPMGDDDGH